ncbi:MAG: phosphate acyltransferase PlsX [Butyrivibrio sp.]|nr:phosphate acyltransferase PlsX [Butyrivibrio sp.]
MANPVNVAVDAMGGDNAPFEIVKGAVDAVNENDKVAVTLVGREEIVKAELAKYKFDESRITVVNADDVIETAEHPVHAIRRKKESSLVIALKLVKEGKADAFVSAGSTGAVLVGGQAIVGRIKGIDRPPLAPVLPTSKGPALLVDCGANVDARSDHLVKFARMGSIYMKYVMGIENPRVAIVNIGAEEEKGNALVKETFPLLKECDDINFIGSIEARDVPSGYADVMVCDAFVGNCILKMFEGVGATLFSEIKASLMSSFRSKLGALLIKPALKKVLKKYDASEYGGAPMIGLNGLVVKSHGSSKAKEIRNSIFQCVSFVEADITGKIRESLIQ